jgi:hypothetical protein
LLLTPAALPSSGQADGAHYKNLADPFLRQDKLEFGHDI